ALSYNCTSIKSPTSHTPAPISLTESSSVAVSSKLALFFFTDTAPTAIYTLSLHDALPIYPRRRLPRRPPQPRPQGEEALDRPRRSEEHTSELQSRFDIVCRLLLEKKKIAGNAVGKDGHQSWARRKIIHRRGSKGGIGPHCD